MGIYVFSRDVLLETLEQEAGLDFGHEIIPSILSRRRTNAFMFRGYWAGVGTVASLYDANMMLTQWRGPWGLTITRNLTPDKETGIGTWTVEDFKKTLRTGIDPKGQVLRPPMPIPGLQNLPDEDLEAIFAFLNTVKPVRNDAGRVGPGIGSTPPPPPRKEPPAKKKGAGAMD
jgi:hypothetical protein